MNDRRNEGWTHRSFIYSSRLSVQRFNWRHSAVSIDQSDKKKKSIDARRNSKKVWFSSDQWGVRESRGRNWLWIESSSIVAQIDEDETGEIENFYWKAVTFVVGQRPTSEFLSSINRRRNRQDGRVVRIQRSQTDEWRDLSHVLQGIVVHRQFFQPLGICQPWKFSETILSSTR